MTLRKHARQNHSRSLRFETLDGRLLLAADAFNLLEPLSRTENVSVTVSDSFVRFSQNDELSVNSDAGYEGNAETSSPEFVPEDWWAPVTASPSVLIELEATDMQGNRIESVAVGEDFTVNIYTQDASEDAKGVFAAFIDMSFDPGLATVVGPLQHASGFQLMERGEIAAPGEIDNFGGVDSPPFEKMGTQRVLVGSVTLRATGEGEMQIKSAEAGEYPFHYILLHGKNQAINPQSIVFGSVTIRVHAPAKGSDAVPVGLGAWDGAARGDTGALVASRAGVVIGADQPAAENLATRQYFGLLSEAEMTSPRLSVTLNESLESEISSLAEALAELGHQSTLS